MTLVAVIGLIGWSTTVPPVPEREPWVPITRLPDAVSQPSLSPDGRQVTFIRGSDTFYGPGQVYLKTLPDGEPVALTHDSLKKMSPTFSPDGSRIAYTTVNALFEWDTWVVTRSGRVPPKPWLRNASGLIWTSPQRVLFSEMRRVPHMGIVAADENGLNRARRLLSAARTCDGASIVSITRPQVGAGRGNGQGSRMGALPRRCHGRPLAGSPGRAAACRVHVRCLVARRQLDLRDLGRGGARHIWRQRFPGGQPEQLTFGPTAEDGIAVAPDGRSLIASVALQKWSIWLHEAQGERQISALEGTAVNAKFTRDGKKLCYVHRQRVSVRLCDAARAGMGR